MKITEKIQAKLISGSLIMTFGAFAVFLGSAVYTIDEGTRGVLLRTGKVIEIVDSGLHFKLPILDTVHRISTRAAVYRFETEGYTKDQQTANLKLSVTFRVPNAKVDEVYTKYKTNTNAADIVVARIAPAQAKNVLGRYTAHNAVQSRDALMNEITQAIQNAINEKEPIFIESVQLEDIEFSKAYEASIEARMKAEVEVTTQKQILETEKVNAEIKKTKAQAEAEAKIIQAKADADAIKLKGDAEADVIEKRGQALAKNPNLVSLVTAESWNGQLPLTMVPNGTLPFVQMPNGVK